MGGQTKGHNWAPKLSMRFWNFHLGNSHTMYDALCKEHTPFRKRMDMNECVCILSHSLMQTGPPLRKQVAEHPKYTRDLTNVFDFGSGRRIRKDAKGEISFGSLLTNEGAPAPCQRYRELR